MRHLDRDLWLCVIAMILFALGVGLYQALLYVYALDLGASRFTIGLLNAIMLAVAAASNIPGAWAARRFRLKPVIVGVWWLGVPTAVCFFLAPSWPWLIPGLVITGLYYGNNPAFKAYIYLKSSPERVARNLTTIYAAFPLGLVTAPLLGGVLAARYGMRPVFVVSAALFTVSAATISLIADTPYHTADAPLSLRSVFANRRFARYLVFFLAGFLAASTAQAFLIPYLKQVHLQGYAALGVYAALAALGSAVITRAMGHITDLHGPRLGAAGVLAAMVAGTALLLGGDNPLLWGIATLCCGSFDALRLVATGIVGDSFGGMPLAWGYAIFDTVMGLPMAGGALLGGLLYRTGYALPFVFAAAMAAFLLGGLAIVRRRAAKVSPAPGP